MAAETHRGSGGLDPAVGDRVEKGEELGYFSYGGSTLCLVSQPNAIDRFTVPDPPPGQDGAAIDVNAPIAVAR